VTGPGDTQQPGSVPASGWRDDLRVLRQLLAGKRSTGDHARDLDRFYGPQAQAYDSFRERLLPGRAAFMQALPLPQGAHVVDLGAGTGRHWHYVAESLPRLASLALVDLCTPLQHIARERFSGQPQVQVVHADATVWRPEHPADLVVFSYSLSMMTDWQAALANAHSMLRPGGVLALIDFCTLPAAPPPPLRPLPTWARWFWPRWFRHDGVLLREAVLPALLASGRTQALQQGHARLPYLPLAGAPWYHWIGEPQRAAQAR
jgi:SAM-dependent methyltransferase